MKKTSDLKFINLDDLKLDIKNPRFAELYTGSTKENDLIEYLLYDEAAEEVAKGIVEANEFYEDRALWVIKESDGKYLVKDGNRRCAAVKALQIPGKFRLDLPKMTFDKLPVYEYYSLNDLMSRITQEHANSLFREWGRIAKALQILELADAGKADEMNMLDSRPSDFIKTGSFYKKAVIYGKDELKKLLSKGRGKTGGKTIMFERLFKYRDQCGYDFKNRPSYRIDITNSGKFELYVKAMIKYLKANPELTTKQLDNKSNFLEELKDYGFYYDTTDGKPLSIARGTSSKNGASSGTGTTTDGKSTHADTTSTSGSGTGSRVSIKRTPKIKRQGLPPGLKKRIDEYFKKIKSDTMANAKIAMARVTYECVLKYVIDNTKSGKIIFKNSGHFGSAYGKKPHVNFEELNKKFIELITEVGYKKAFINFEFEKMHQVIHNYIVTGSPHQADATKDNLIELIEFMLQKEEDLLNCLDLTKIK